MRRYGHSHVNQGSSAKKGSASMKLRHNENTQMRPQARRRAATAPSEAADHSSDWTTSSLDLRLGLDVVEISADVHWADTQSMSALPPGQ
jgi:hypothetical protein